MARNVNEIEADEEAEQGAIMDRDTFLGILEKYSEIKGKSQKEAGKASALLSQSEKNHNLHKKALSIVHWGGRQEPAALNIFLHHLDAYREYAGLDQMAGTDMFEGAPAGPRKAASKETGANRAKAPKVAKPLKASRKGKPGIGRPKGSLNKKKVPPAEPVSAADAAAQAWGLNKETETAGAA